MMLYVLCASAVMAGVAGLAAVGVVIAITPWERIPAEIEGIRFLYLAVAGCALFAMTLIQTSLTAMVAGTLGLRLVWRDEDMKQRQAQKKRAASAKPAARDLKPRKAE